VSDTKISPRSGKRPEGARRRSGRLALAAAAVVAAGLSAAAGFVALPSHADEQPAGPEIIPIDLLLAGGHTEVARAAIDIWNRAVPSIRFVEQSTPATLRVREHLDDGAQTRADPDGLGRGWVLIDVANLELTKDWTRTRIVVHELGHILSLPHPPAGTPGVECVKVMAGPGPNCTNEQPDAAERAAVADYFARYDLGDEMPDWSEGPSQTVSRGPEHDD
jgi:snapalysin